MSHGEAKQHRGHSEAEGERTTGWLLQRPVEVLGSASTEPRGLADAPHEFRWRICVLF